MDDAFLHMRRGSLQAHANASRHHGPNNRIDHARGVIMHSVPSGSHDYPKKRVSMPWGCGKRQATHRAVVGDEGLPIWMRTIGRPWLSGKGPSICPWHRPWRAPRVPLHAHLCWWSVSLHDPQHTSGIDRHMASSTSSQRYRAQLAIE